MKPLNIDDIANLVTRFKDGDEDAFIELYNQMYQKIYFLAISIVKDEYLAQDVIQETFISVYRNIGGLDNNQMFTAWLNRIAYNCSLKMLVNSKEEIPIDEITVEKEMAATKAADPLDMVLSKDENNKIMNCILALPPEFKTTLILRYYADFKLDEIAVAMECSLGTVKSRLSRGKTALRKSLWSEGRILSVLMLGGITFGLTMRSTMEAYASEHPMTSTIANEALAVIQKQKGVQETLAIVSTQIGTTAAGINKGIVLALGGFAMVSTGMFGLQGAQINVFGCNGDYTNQSITIKVEIESMAGFPIQSISLIEQGIEEEIGISKADKKTYQAEIKHNGNYYVEVGLSNGKTVRHEFQVDRIDKEKPDLYWYSWDINTGLFYGLVSDDLSGVDFRNTYTEEESGIRSNLVAFAEDTGEIEILLPEDTTKMTIYDNAGNRAVYEISPYMTEQE